MERSTESCIGEGNRDATIKYHKIFRIHFEKFLLLMHDNYEIIMFSPSPTSLSLSLPRFTQRLHFASRSNRDNMNFLLSFSVPESAFYVTRLYAFWIFSLRLLWGKRAKNEEFVGIKKRWFSFFP